MKQTLTEENYLKAIFLLSAETEGEEVSTNAIAGDLHTSAASVSDMLKKLSDKGLIDYEKYKGVSLSKKGRQIAITIVRRHRLWEYFLVDKLKMSWDEVHDVAEELEHIDYPSLIDRLDAFLGTPRYDPHGDPIPDKNGHINAHRLLMHDLQADEEGVIVGVKDHTADFLQYLEETGLMLKTSFRVIKRFAFDDSLLIQTPARQKLTLSGKISQNLFVQRKK